MNLTPQQYLFLLILLLSAGFILDMVLDWLNLKSRKKEMPEGVRDLYDKKEYERALDYQATLTRFGFVSSTFSFGFTFLMLLLGGFGYLDLLLRSQINNPILLALAFFGILVLASDILTLPFQYYRTFVIEERFGFNKTTPRLFITDKLKGYLLGILVGGGLLALLIWLIGSMGSSFWMYFWIAISVFILLANSFYTSLIVPLFNKLTPLDDESLRNKIEAYCNSVGFPVKNVFVIDGSKRSTKANAFFSGIGGRKKIVLYDTLLENHSEQELIAVLAHEVGHYKKKHIIWGLLLSILQTGLMLYIMSLLIFNERLSLALGASEWGIHLNLLAFGLLYSPISTILGVFSNHISRRNEYEADAFAGSTYAPEALQLALKKLSVKNLSNLFPHPAYVFVHYSHPPLLKRLTALQKFVHYRNEGPSSANQG
jgi:STE24 endopeptidase